jgi:adenine phosphoribosyltransferase
MTLQEIQSLIRDVPDFPKPGIVFKDITPLLASPRAFKSVVDHLAERLDGQPLDGVLGIESRGFIFGAALAQRLDLSLQLVRKKGKLPRKTVSVRYELEYGFDQLELHADAIEPGGRYVVVDDLIATGGTAAAVAKLVAEQGGEVVSCLFVIELSFLDGRKALDGFPVDSLLRY